MAASISYFFRPSSSLICSEPSVVLDVNAFLTEESNCQLFCCSVYNILIVLMVLESFERPLGKQDVLLFEVDDDRSGESPKRQEAYCCYWKLLPPEDRRLFLEPQLP